MDRVAIVILNYKTYLLTINCIYSILQKCTVDFQIFVIDNNSGNESLEKIQKWVTAQGVQSVLASSRALELYSQKIVLIQNENNDGYSKGNNIGISFASINKHEYVLILNNDIEIKNNSISQLISYAKSNTRIGCLSPLLYRSNGEFEKNCARRRLKWYDFSLLSGIGMKLLPFSFFRKHHFINPIKTKPFPAEMISGSAMFFPIKVLQEIDGFDENVFLYYEEAILCEKLLKKGLCTYVVPQSVMIHNHAQTTSQVNSRFILKTSLNSQFYYLRKYRNMSAICCYFIMSANYLTYFLFIIKTIINKIKNGKH